MKEKRFSKILTSAKKDPEVFLSPEFLNFLDFESKKRKINPLLFFSKNKKYMKKIKH